MDLSELGECKQPEDLDNALNPSKVCGLSKDIFDDINKEKDAVVSLEAHRLEIIEFYPKNHVYIGVSSSGKTLNDQRVLVDIEEAILDKLDRKSDRKGRELKNFLKSVPKCQSSKVVNASLSNSDFRKRRQLLCREAEDTWEVGKKLGLSANFDDNTIIEELVVVWGMGFTLFDLGVCIIFSLIALFCFVWVNMNLVLDEANLVANEECPIFSDEVVEVDKYKVITVEAKETWRLGKLLELLASCDNGVIVERLMSWRLEFKRSSTAIGIWAVFQSSEI
ncbi:hypothetical protein REPUB_Repub15cG0122300 [Reevesia pubescens]